MTTIRIKLPTIKQVEFRLIAEEEFTPIRGNAVASGNDEFDNKVENEIIERLDNGNEWAWCTATVVCNWKELSATDSLGCCSYNSENDFIKNSGYYEDMKQTAYNDLIQQIKNLKA